MTISKKLFTKSKKYIPGGVNSPVRAFKSVGLTPFFVKKAKGQYIFDEDNKKYIDYVGSWGAQILGHADNRILKNISGTIKKGITFGAPCENEILLAKKIIEIFPAIEKIRMVNSGTEATMSAIRLARGYTNRDKIIKFDGCYHGHGDSFLIKAGSGSATFGKPDSKGVTKSLAKDTISLPYNNIDKVKPIIKNNNIACVIIEPIAGNMNFVRSNPDFLKELRVLCNRHKTVLIFDEVMTGLRVAKAGAQNVYNVKPDLVTLGKVLGGGFPIGAFGGKKIIMDNLAPDGDVYQAGTLSGNPIAMAAGLKTIEVISTPKYFIKLHNKTMYLVNRMNDMAKKFNKNFYADGQGGMFGMFFTNNKINNFEDMKKLDNSIFVNFFQFMLHHGIFFAPSMFEAGFISSAHTKKDLDYTLKVFKKWLENN